MRSWEAGRFAKLAVMAVIVFATSGIWSACASFYGRNTQVVLFLVYAPALYGLLLLIWWVVDSGRRRERQLAERLKQETEAGQQLCRKAIESLTYALEGRTSYQLGHLARVQAYSAATARAMDLPDEMVEGMRVAALVHDIGRLGVPEGILAMSGAAPHADRERARAYPVLGSRLLASVPFPWPIADVVRHHREHYDGSGYPDGLSRNAIPLEARILAVADTFDTLVTGGSSRDAIPARSALVEIQARGGKQFDPVVVRAFAGVVEPIYEQTLAADRRSVPHAASYEIAKSQREMQALYDLACAAGASVQLDAVLATVAEKIFGIVTCSTCVFFLMDDDEGVLQSAGAFGLNRAFFHRCRARIDTGMTSRSAGAGEAAAATCGPEDIELRHSLEMWTPLASTLTAPIPADGRILGAINLYHTEPDAFEPDDIRVTRYVGELAGRAIQNALLFAESNESANTDAVTGLRNRRFLRTYLAQELNRAEKNRLSLAVMELDMDRFKAVNDTYGHERGDQVLRDAAQAMERSVRNYDLVVRHAGDEFVIVLPDTNRREAEVVAEKVTAAIDAYVDALIASDPAFPRVGISAGIAIYPDDAASMAALLESADAAMYARKRERGASRAA